MYRFLEYLYLILRILFVVYLFLTLAWILDNPTAVGTWTAKFNKAMITEFDKR